MRADVRGRLDLARRDSVAALRDFEASPDSACWFDGCYTEWFTEAQLLETMNRDRDAMRILDHEYVQVDPERVLWRLERTRVAERLGERMAARRLGAAATRSGVAHCSGATGRGQSVIWGQI